MIEKSALFLVQDSHEDSLEGPPRTSWSCTEIYGKFPSLITHEGTELFVGLQKLNFTHKDILFSRPVADWTRRASTCRSTSHSCACLQGPLVFYRMCPRLLLLAAWAVLQLTSTTTCKSQQHVCVFEYLHFSLTCSRSDRPSHQLCDRASRKPRGKDR